MLEKKKIKIGEYFGALLFFALNFSTLRFLETHSIDILALSFLFVPPHLSSWFLHFVERINIKP